MHEPFRNPSACYAATVWLHFACCPTGRRPLQLCLRRDHPLRGRAALLRLFMHTFKPERNSLLAMFIGIANHHRSRRRCPAFHRLPLGPPSISATINPFCFFFFYFPFFFCKPASSCHAEPTLSLSASSQLGVVCLPSGLQVLASTHSWALGQAWGEWWWWRSGGGGEDGAELLADLRFVSAARRRNSDLWN